MALTHHTKASLKAFEAEIADLFNSGTIRAPVHLDGGNEKELLQIFEKIGPNDWVLGSWRQHYHALLKGVPEPALMAEILKGRSISLSFPNYRILSSAIVAGICPIAVGLGMGIKLMGGKERVWAFVGDMTAETGLFYECAKYAHFQKLPVHWIVEDNGKSVTTNTREACFGIKYQPLTYKQKLGRDWNIDGYRYDLQWPHSGAGVRVNF